MSFITDSEGLVFAPGWFLATETGVERKTGQTDLPFLDDDQYFRINGSDFNNDIHQYPASDLTDEVFYGSIWPLKIPSALLALVTEIEEWQAEYGSSSAALGPFQSESFGGYSYSKASSSGSSSTGSSSAVTLTEGAEFGLRDL